MPDLYDYSLLLIFAVGLGAILIMSEVGRRAGTRLRGRGGYDISTLESAVLGLLALMIGFTFAMALARYDARRDAVLNEANSIGTTALRARMLPEPHRQETLKLLLEYGKIRVDVTRADVTRANLTAGIERSNQIQESLWQQAMAVAAKDNALVPTGLFIQTLNEMIDNQTKRLTAFRHHVPDIVIVALFAIAAVAGGFAGYTGALGDSRTRMPVTIIALLVSTVIMLILDLDRTASGFIKVSQQPMIDTVSSIQSYR